MAEEEDDARRAKMKGAGRRKAVANEAVSSESVKDYVKPVHKKDAATMERIQNLIRSNEKLRVLFGHLDDKTLRDIVDAFQEVSSKQGEDVIRQGDAGDCLYIVNTGAVDVFVARPNADGSLTPGDRGKKVVSCGPGDMFGELALMYSCPRAATVTISSSVCALWRLDREPFKMLSAQQSQQQYELYEGWLSEVDILRTLNKYELSRLSEAMESKLYDTGEVVILQGDVGDYLYILEDGECAAYVRDGTVERRVKDYTTKGDYFGEIALLKDVPRKATVRATGDGAVLLLLSKEDFVNILGPIHDRLKKDLDKY